MIGQMALRGQERSSFLDCYCVMTVSVHSEDCVFLDLTDLISAYVTLAVLLYCEYRQHLVLPQLIHVYCRFQIILRIKLQFM